MSATLCKVDACPKPVRAKGWCQAHYLRHLRHGSPLAGGEPRHHDPEDAFAARVAWDGEHLVWIGAVDGRGYGHMTIGGRSLRAHRYAWEREHGPIPDGAHVDHACWVRTCVLSDHLRLATNAQNVASRSGPTRGRKHDLPRNVYREKLRYAARVSKDGVTYNLGNFDTPEAAARVAAAKRAELFGEYAGREPHLEHDYSEEN